MHKADIVRELNENAEFYGGDEYADGLRKAAQIVNEMEIATVSVIHGKVSKLIPVMHNDELYYAMIKQRGKQVICSEVHRLEVYEVGGITMRCGFSYIKQSKAVRKIVADKAKKLFTEMSTY